MASRIWCSEGDDGNEATPTWTASVLGSAVLEAHRQPCFQARLWLLLVVSFFVLMFALAFMLTVLWYRDHSRTIDEMQEVYDVAIGKFNHSVDIVTENIVKRIQGQLVRRAQEMIKDFLKVPELVVTTNINSVRRGLLLFPPMNISRSLEVLWMETLENPQVTDNLYADDTGVVAGYEHIDNGSYLATYRPPNIFGSSPGRCPVTCPPLSELKPGKKSYWIANSTTGAYERYYKSSPYELRNRPWYRLALAAQGVRAWTRPFAYTNGIDIGMDCVQSQHVDGRTIVFDASISLHFLTKFLERVHKDLHQSEEERNNSLTFIVDQNGEMIASSRGLEKVLKKGADGVKQRRTWRELEGFSVKAALTQLNATGLTLPLPNSSMFPDAYPSDFPSVYLNFEGGPYLCAYGTLKFPKSGLPDAAIDWIIVSIVRKRVYLNELYETITVVNKTVVAKKRSTEAKLSTYTRRTFFFSGALTLVGGLLMAFVARAITSPIRRISKEMRSIAELKFMDTQLLEDQVALRAKQRAPEDRDATAVSDTAEGGHDECEESVGSESTSLDSEAESLKLRADRCGRCSLQVTELVEMRQAFASMSIGLQSFAKYVDPHVVELLVRGNVHAELGVQKADVTIFFSDIANFTTMGEKLKPEVFMDLLSEYLEEMSNIIMQHEGIVGEYIGDGIMAWWNTPIAIERHTVQALAAALEQQNRLETLRRRWCARGLPEVRCRMGLARGTVLAGNVGSRGRMKFGLVGDSVNLASRLEALCKRYGVFMILDASAQSAPGVRERFLCRPLDLVVVKGRNSTTELFELVGARAEADGGEALSFVEDFERIHVLYRAGDFRAALQALDLYRRRWPEDVPARMLAERCRALLARPPGPGWTPVEALSEK